MEFIDSTGHVFSLPSYDNDPIKFKYTENEYIFWLKESSVSIKNYYIKPIRFLIDKEIIDQSNNVFDIEISNDSRFYQLISSKYFQQQLESSNTISQSVGLDKSQFKSKLTLDDFYFDSNNENDNLIVSSGNTENKFYMFPFYVVGFSEIEGTFLNNIIIKYKYVSNNGNILQNYTPITVGCTFIDECEELIINGKNMGIKLPKEILKAIYTSSFYTKYADEKLLKNKLKELLLNYMNIKGETGNIKSMLNSLKWFGWNNYIEISQLIKTDNRIQDQFILDYFSIKSDIKETFKYFNRTNNITLMVKSNIDTFENYKQNHEAVLIGEGKPILENLFDKNIEVTKDGITFYKPYYRFIFNELALKLDCLKYYYQQYFLPVHINIHQASIAHKVYANTTKMSAIGFTTLVDSPLYLPNDAQNINVIFPKTNRLLFKQDIHLIDSKFNEFSNYNDEYESEDLFFVNENCITIPITFINNTEHYEENTYGQYILVKESYEKINYFYELIDNSFSISNHISGTYYSFEKFKNIQPLDSITRYDKSSNLYSLDDHGDYYRDDEGNYIKINYFYKMVNEEEGVLSDRFNGTHFSLVKNEEITSLEDIIRYSKVSEGYFNCKMILTATTFNQNDKGHYVYIDGKYIYKKEFYKNNFTDNPDNIYSDDINDSFSYIKYYDKFIKIDSKDRYDIEMIYLINNNNFNFYQSSSQYYQNLVIIPRILNSSLDWENANYRLSILVNNKWFNYDFRIATPNIYLDLGKLEYKYAIEYQDQYGSHEYCPFNQLRSLNSSKIEFNSFMYEPDLVTINTLFKEVDENDNTKLLTFLDKLLQTKNKYNMPDEHKMYEFYKKYYSNIVRVPYNEKYYNRIHLFNIYKNGSQLEYLDINSNTIDTEFISNINGNIELLLNTEGSIDVQFISNNENEIQLINPEVTVSGSNNTNLLFSSNLIYTEEDIINLYRDFFIDGSGNHVSPKITIMESVKYDFYLMHDEKYWYVVLISAYPLASYIDKSSLDIHKTEYNLGSYNIQYANYSIDKFLVNRMVIKRTNGLNHFNMDDLIVVGINNNEYQFNIDLDNKWSILPIKDINSVYKVNSNTNLMIVPNNNVDNMYTPGYYNVELKYTINGLNNILHRAIAQYRVFNTFKSIKYPEIIEIPIVVETFSIKDTISDFTILYENNTGNQYKSRDVIDPSLGWHPIGIKILNKGYFGSEQRYSIYIGLKMLSTVKDSNGEFKFNNSGSQPSNSIPYFGFYNIDIPTLKNYPYICYIDEEHTGTRTQIYPQTDRHDNVNSWPDNYNDETLAGQFKWPAPNERGWRFDPNSANGKANNINLLNDDDTFNSNLIDENCSVSDWNGWQNTMDIIKAFDEEYSIIDNYGRIDEHNIENWFYTSGNNAGNIKNNYNLRFSPMVACAYKYKTTSTNNGDWYIPAFAEVFFLSYNFQRLTNLFNEISSKYPEDCKIDLLTSLGSNALWTTTEYSSTQMWEIHPSQHAHPLGKSTTWRSFPYIRIEE